MKMILAFPEIVNLLTPYYSGSQASLVNTLLKWITDRNYYDHYYNDHFHISPSTVTKYVKYDQPIAKFAKLVRGHEDKEQLEEAINNNFDTKGLSDALKKRKNDKSIHPSDVAEIIATSLMSAIEDASSSSQKLVNSSNDSSKSKQNNQSMPSSTNPLILKVDKTFSKRFPDSDQYKHAFNIFTPHTSFDEHQNEGRFELNTTQYDKNISDLLCAVPLIIARVSFSPLDRLKGPTHPFGINANEPISTLPDDPPIADIKGYKIIRLQGREVYADKDGTPIKVNGNYLPRFTTLKESVTPSPEFVYICEVTSVTTRRISPSKLKVSFVYHCFGKIRHELFYNNRSLFGIPSQDFSNDCTSEYKYIKNVNLLDRLNEILSTNQDSYTMIE